MKIQPYSPEYETAVIALWQKCNLVRPQNNPKKDIARKLKVNPELFLVGLIDGKVVATAMGGYDGHRGWVNYVGVDPAYKRQGLGRQIMEALVQALLAKGCPKFNLLVRTDNLGAIKFYENLGFNREDCVEMGKRLIPD
jgi:ribosomal protein S18 acetylase RimI-like enzyme